ncbi:DUF1294 domain-containing protein [Desulfosporosinus meridiei]|uniref:Putative membrane protein n=1 Tax=Desulfosporosinus meridiei (strain ATCC BAA-275 / DSM 13257 / KCTC 12902 / NCIMB 13706 / S10) TaxID=768704 RepID=J7IND0_DESMD|nr:DUF1294 domain-containing protein [Desulfosporosinus meridiei]AFQ43292.1 putative membrane protein [Desulfosporosinus meridiei DSM 13257]
MSMGVFLGAYVLWNSYVFIAMGRDKRRAKLNRWRISESSLLLMGAALGGVGLYAGMKYFHHKTKHAKFRIGSPLLILLNLLVVVLFYYIGWYRII